MRATLATGALILAFGAAAGCGPARPNVAELAAKADRAEGYPARYLRLDNASREERVKAFRAKNPGEWISVALDFYGFATYVTRADPAMVEDPGGAPWKRPPFTPEELAYYRDLLARNAELFGITDPAKVKGAGDANGIQIEQRFLGKVIAQIEVGRYGPSRTAQGVEPGGTYVGGHLWPKLVEPRSLLTNEEIAGPIVGLPASIELECMRHPCDPAGPNTTCPEPRPPARAAHAVRFEDLRFNDAQRVIHSQSGRGPAEIRALVSVDLLQQECPKAPPGCEGYREKCPLALDVELAGNPYGWVFDRVTGELLRDPYVGASE